MTNRIASYYASPSPAAPSSSVRARVLAESLPIMQGSGGDVSAIIYIERGSVVEIRRDVAERLAGVGDVEILPEERSHLI